MDPIASFSGLASGIQWRDMIDQIMKLESSRRLKPVTDQVSLQQKRRTAWDSFNNLVSKLRDSATSFKDGSAFGLFGTSVSDSATGRKLVSASASDKAAPGTYKLEVLELAKAEKLGGSSLSSATDALGLSGSFSVNGQSVTLDTADSLSAVRDKINAVSGTSGVTATILSTSSTSHRLVLTANETGASGIQLTDGADGLLGSRTAGGLQGLGFLSNASAAVSSTQKSLELALGVSPPPAKTTVLVGGVKVEVDFANDTLLTLQDKFSQAGATATIKQETVNGRATYRLVSDKAVTADSAPTVGTATDSQNVASALAFATSDVGSQITAGSDAKVTIDGYTITRSSNKIADAIEGVTLDLLASDAASRTAATTGTGLTLEYAPKTVGVGTYGVAVSSSSTKTATTSSASLSVGTVPSTMTAGAYDVNITALAKVASATGAGFDNSYNQASLLGPDTITITDGAGKATTVSLGDGQNLATIVNNLNTAFTGNGLTMRAVDSGGQLRLESTTAAGSSSTFSISSSGTSVQTNLGIANGTYTGSNIQGTIGGQSATGSGSTLTTAAGLEVTYSGTGTGVVGSVTISDTQTITGATIGGIAATWDATTKTIRGATGTAFEGVELAYSGTVTSGSVGNLVIEGDISADLTISRDLEGTKKKVQEFVDAYNAVANFLKRQRDTKGPLSTDGSLRSMVGSLREVMFKDVQGLSATNTYTRLSLAGVEFTDQGTLKLKSTTLENALSTNQYDIKELFAGFGTMMESSADVLADEYEGSIKQHSEALSVSIKALENRRENIEAQLERRRITMTKQFTAMELAMTQLQSQSGSLSSQLLSMQPRS